MVAGQIVRQTVLVMLALAGSADGGKFKFNGRIRDMRWFAHQDFGSQPISPLGANREGAVLPSLGPSLTGLVQRASVKN